MRVSDLKHHTRNESNSGETFGHHPPATTLRRKGLSVSINAGTRKMVNYAWLKLKSPETVMEDCLGADVQIAPKS